MIMVKTRAPLSQLLVAAFLGSFGAATVAPGSTLPQTALGHGGEVYRVLDGEYGELFPDSDMLPAAHQVLALEIDPAEGGIERRLVPGSEAAGADGPAVLLYDRVTEALSIVWEAWGETVVTTHLVTWTPVAEWSEGSILYERPTAVLGTRGGLLSRDSYTLELEDGTAARVDRLILHCLWFEEEGGQQVVYYTPIIFTNGRFAGRNEIFRLNSLFESADGAAEPPAEGLEATFALREAEASDAILVGFVHPADGQLKVLRIGILPLEVAYFSDRVLDAVFELEEAYDPKDLGDFASKHRMEMIGMGVRLDFHPAVREYVADRTTDWILEHGAEFAKDLVTLAEELRSYTVDLTASLIAARTLKTDGGDSAIVRLEPEAGESDPPQLLDLRLAATYSLPSVEADQPELLLSESGEKAIVLWPSPDGTSLLYRESSADGGWSEARGVGLEDGISIDGARQLLRDRLR